MVVRSALVGGECLSAGAHERAVGWPRISGVGIVHVTPQGGCMGQCDRAVGTWERVGCLGESLTSGRSGRGWQWYWWHSVHRS